MAMSTVRPLVNRHGSVIGRLERDGATGIVTPFWDPQPRTLAEDHPTPRLPSQTRICGYCGDAYQLVRDASGVLMPCSNCGRDWRGAVVTFAAPDTLGRTVALQQHATLVAEATPVPVTAVAARPQVRETYAPHGQTMDRVLTSQVAQKQREPLPARLYAGASQQCPRCGVAEYRTCACPPTPPDTLGAAVQRGREQDQRQAAALLAAHPKLEHWD